MITKIHSLGRIKEIILFDINTFAIDKPEKLQEKVKNRYNNLLKKFDELEIRVYIFLRARIKAAKPGEPFPQTIMTDTELKCIRYIIINGKWPGGNRKNPIQSIPTRWVKDLMINGTAGTIYYNQNKIKEQLAEIMRMSLDSELKLIPFNMKTAGGDLLIGQNNINAFYIHAGEKPSDLLLNQLGIISAKAINLNDVSTPAPTRIVFHADMFCTLIGKYGKRQKVLLAEVIAGNKNVIDLEDDIFSDYQTRLRRIPGLQQVLRLPLILIHNEEKTIKFCLTYNNCLVENYMLGDKQVIRFLMPDYTETVITYLKRYVNYKNENSFIDNNNIENNLAAWSEWLGMEVITENKFTIKKINELADDTKMKIKRILTKELSDAHVEIHWLDANFYELAGNFGSLHCLTHVVKREQV